MNSNSSSTTQEAAPPLNDAQKEVQEKANQKIEAGLQQLRKQCKQLSKNQLITTLLQQLEMYAQLQGACQQLLAENKSLKGNKDEKINTPT